MDHQRGNHFDSIESAQGFLSLLTEVVADTKQVLDADAHGEASAKSPRRLEALRIAAYQLEKLELHLHRSVRILNDLRTLRRLLFGERHQKVQPPKSVPVTKTAAPVVQIPVAPPSSPAVPAVAKPGRVGAA